MAESTSGRKKVYISQSKGNALINDKKETNVGIPPGKFNKKYRNVKAQVAEKDVLPDKYW